MFSWRATVAEREQVLPGDELLPEGAASATHAISIAASRTRVWPWLIQMGAGRAGFYSYDWIDNAGRASAREILPDYQALTVGDVFPARVGGAQGFEVVHLDPPETLLTQVHVSVPSFEILPWNAPSPKRAIRYTWLFQLTESRGQTRLVTRSRADAHPSWLRFAMRIMLQTGHVVMQRKQLLGIKRRVESQSGRGSP